MTWDFFKTPSGMFSLCSRGSHCQDFSYYMLLRNESDINIWHSFWSETSWHGLYYWIHIGLLRTSFSITHVMGLFYNLFGDIFSLGSRYSICVQYVCLPLAKSITFFIQSHTIYYAICLKIFLRTLLAGFPIIRISLILIS